MTVHPWPAFGIITVGGPAAVYALVGASVALPPFIGMFLPMLAGVTLLATVVLWFATGIMGVPRRFAALVARA